MSVIVLGCSSYAYIFYISDQIADTPAVLQEFARSCAEAGEEYCVIAQANSTQASIMAWIQELMNTAFELYKPAQYPDSLPSAVMRGQDHSL